MAINQIEELFDQHKGNNFHLAVALGYVGGWESFRKFGMNEGVVSSTTQEMWPIGTTRVLPTSAAVASAASSDADDTSAGAGARTIQVDGLDANGLEVSDTITMNGVTPATTTQTFLRINRAFITSSGATNGNEGNITITVGGDTQAYIEATQGQSHQTHYTVPSNKFLIVTGLTVGCGRMSGSTDLAVLSQVDVGGGWRTISDIHLWNGGRHQANQDNATLLPPGTEARQIINSSASTQAHGIFSGYLVDATYLPQ